MPHATSQRSFSLDAEFFVLLLLLWPSLSVGLLKFEHTMHIKRLDVISPKVQRVGIKCHMNVAVNLSWLGKMIIH